MKEASSIVDAILNQWIICKQIYGQHNIASLQIASVDKSLQHLIFEGLDNMSLKEKPNTSQHLLVNNLTVELFWRWQVMMDWGSEEMKWDGKRLAREQFKSWSIITWINFWGFDNKNHKENQRQKNFGSCIIWKFNNHLGAKLWESEQHEVSRNWREVTTLIDKTIKELKIIVQRKKIKEKLHFFNIPLKWREWCIASQNMTFQVEQIEAFSDERIFVIKLEENKKTAQQLLMNIERVGNHQSALMFEGLHNMSLKKKRKKNTT